MYANPVRTKRLVFLGASLVLALIVQHAQASETITIPLNGNYVLRLPNSANQVVIGNQKIIRVTSLTNTQLLITGQTLGNTQMTVWYGAKYHAYSIMISLPVDHLRKKMKEVFPGESIHVEPLGEGVVLIGQVTDATTADRARQIAEAYIKSLGQTPNVLNYLAIQGEQQVQLRVKVAEVSRSSLREMGMNFWTRGTNNVGGLLSPGGNVNKLPATESNPYLGLPNATTTGTGESGSSGTVPVIMDPMSADAFGIFFITQSIANFPMAIALNLLAQKGLAKILSEPVLVAYSGKKASFLSGGEFPVPIPQSLGQIAIEYKKYGVQLEFTPTVVGVNSLHMKVAISVSDKDQGGAVTIGGVTVPVLTSRSSDTTVRLKDGQSFAIAGLLHDRIESYSSKIPLLGDLPLLGVAFRRTFSRRIETELVVLVTANIVQPLRPGETPPLPGEDELSDPSDVSFFLLGTIDAKMPRNKTRQRQRGPAGPIGFSQ